MTIVHLNNGGIRIECDADRLTIGRHVILGFEGDETDSELRSRAAEVGWSSDGIRDLCRECTETLEAR